MIEEKICEIVVHRYYILDDMYIEACNGSTL